MAIDTFDRNAQRDAANRIIGTREINCELQATDAPDIHLTIKSHFNSIPCIQRIEPPPYMSAQHGKAQCAGQRARVGKLFLLVLLTLSRPPERCARQYPGPIVQVMVRNVRQQADILEFQLQRIFLVSPEPHSRQLQRIVAKVALTDFQFKEQAGQGRRARVLTYRLHYYVNVGKLHVVVHWSEESRPHWLVSRTEERAHGDACRFRGNPPDRKLHPLRLRLPSNHRCLDAVASTGRPCGTGPGALQRRRHVSNPSPFPCLYRLASAWLRFMVQSNWPPHTGPIPTAPLDRPAHASSDADH